MRFFRGMRKRFKCWQAASCIQVYYCAKCSGGDLVHCPVILLSLIVVLESFSAAIRFGVDATTAFVEVRVVIISLRQKSLRLLTRRVGGKQQVVQYGGQYASQHRTHPIYLQRHTTTRKHTEFATNRFCKNNVLTRKYGILSMAISQTTTWDVWDLSQWHSNRVQKHFWAGECFRVTLQCCMAMLLGWHWSAYRPGFESGPVRKVRSREFMRVCYRINILGSQLSPNSINLIPA